MDNIEKERKEFEAWIVKEHTDGAKKRGMMETREHEALIEGINKSLVRKFKCDGEYKDEEVQNKWEGWKAARQSSQSEPVALMDSVGVFLHLARVASAELLVEALREIIIHDDSEKYVCEKIARKALAAYDKLSEGTQP